MYNNNKLTATDVFFLIIKLAFMFLVFPLTILYFMICGMVDYFYGNGNDNDEGFYYR
jgi:hypothetical protein